MSVPGLPLALAASFLLAPPARAGVVEVVPSFNAPVTPSPVVAQLALDLASFGPSGAIPSLAPSALPVMPAAWSVMTAAVAGVPLAAIKPAAPGAPAVRPAAVKTDALARIKVAQEVLGKYDPAEFAKLNESERAAALASLWDGWKAKGLVADPAPADNAAELDRLILAGVDDKALTAANKSVFLGVAVLGYPLADALWLARTRIQDAIDDNALRYPEGQTWHTPDHTPEFLGTTPLAQELVDAWGAATVYARQIAAQVRAGSTVLPKSSAASPAAAASFARLIAELRDAGDAEAIDYLTGRDPTFTAFLLDARKPGYYLYNGVGPVVARVLATKAAARMGVRRLEHPIPGLSISSSYLYRPARVLDRLREVEREPAGDHGEAEKALLAAYAPRIAALLGPAPAPEPAAPYSFRDAASVPSSALDSPRNSLAAYPYSPSFQRWDLAIPLASLRERVKSGKPHASLDEDRWASLARLFKASAGLRGKNGTLRLVSERWQTGGRLVARDKDGKGVAVQLALLDEISRLAREEPKSLGPFLRFAAAAVDGALIY